MNLLLTGCFNYTQKQIEALRSLGYSIFFMQHENKELPVNASEIDAIVCNGLFLNHDISNFSNLKFIQLTSAGFDRVPMNQVKEYNIELHNAKGVYSKPMAEWAIFQILQHYKQGWQFKEQQESHQWKKIRNLREIVGSKVAIIGAGNVGQEIAKRLHAFEVSIIGFDTHTNKIPWFDKMMLTSDLKVCVQDIDILIITAPLLTSTRRLINREIISSMKQNSMLINLSRGGLIDEDGLCDILTIRKDLFAALDVFEIEPLPEYSMLWKLDNVALSPHNSFVSEGNNRRMFDLMYNNLKQFINN